MRSTAPKCIAQRTDIRSRKSCNGSNPGICRRTLLIEETRLKCLDVGPAYDPRNFASRYSVFKGGTHQRSNKTSEYVENGFFFFACFTHTCECRSAATRNRARRNPAPVKPANAETKPTILPENCR